jgi:hypothetical protein
MGIVALMHYRIEISRTRDGFARLDFPGRVIALEATQHVGPVWLVGVVDTTGDGRGDGGGDGSVTVRADSAGDAVWRVAQATVRAFALLTKSPIEDAIKPSPDDYLTNLV